MTTNHFIFGYIIQKSGEFIVLSLCYTGVIYAGRQSAGVPTSGMLAPESFSFVQSFLAGFATASSFFLFTLYPFAVLLPLLLVRWLLLKGQKKLIPVASAGLSVAYIQLWSLALGYPFRLLPEWAVSAVMIAFIIISSFKLYPEFSEKCPDNIIHRA